MPKRHFPPPWSVEELDSCFVVKDANGQTLAYMYFDIAAIFAKLSELLGKRSNDSASEEGGAK